MRWVEFSPSLGSRAYSRERIMTCTDLFKVLPRWRYVAEKQLILCSRQFGLCPCICFHIQIPERISNESGSHDDDDDAHVDSKLSKLPKTHRHTFHQIFLHACLSWRISWTPRFARNLGSECQCIACTENNKTQQTKREDFFDVAFCRVFVLCVWSNNLGN